MDIVSFINSNLTAVDTAIFYIILSAMVQALPDPDADSGKLYRFIYKFAHTIVANWKLVSKQHKEDIRDIKFQELKEQIKDA